MPQGRSTCLFQKSTTILKCELYLMQPEVRCLLLQGGAIALSVQIIFLGLLMFLSIFPPPVLPHPRPCSHPHVSVSARQKCGDLSPPQGGPRRVGSQPEVTHQGGDPWKGGAAVLLGRLRSL